MNYKAVPIEEAKPLLKINQSYPIIVSYHYKHCARTGDSIIRYSNDITHVLLPVEEIPASPPLEVAEDDIKKKAKAFLTEFSPGYREALEKMRVRSITEGVMTRFAMMILSEYQKLSTPKCKVMEEEIREAAEKHAERLLPVGFVDDWDWHIDNLVNFVMSLSSPLPSVTEEEKEVELIYCECGHDVPHKFATFDGEHYTCMECHISWLEGLLAKADNTDEGINELFDTHSAAYEDDDGNIQYALNIHDFRRVLGLYKQSLSAKEKGEINE